MIHTTVNVTFCFNYYGISLPMKDSFQQATQRTQYITSSLVVECEQRWNDSICYTVSPVSFAEKCPYL